MKVSWLQPHNSLFLPRFIHDVFVLGEEGGWIGELHLLVEAGVLVKRVALELPAADAHERDAVAVPGINVGGS